MKRLTTPQILVILAAVLLCLCSICGISSSIVGGMDATQNTPIEEIVTIDSNNEIYKVIQVVDGDTIQIDMNGESAKVRFVGIDTPELHHPSKPVECFAQEAKDYLETKIGGQYVGIERDLSQDDQDRYGRLLRYVSLDSKDIGLDMIRSGYAFEYTYKLPYNNQYIYKEAEKLAIKNKSGLWANDTCNGGSEFINPNPTITKITKPSPTQTPSILQVKTQPVTPTPPATSTPIVTPILIPTKTITYAPTPISTVNTNTNGWVCNCSKTCPNMSSCAEAYFQLNTCGCYQRDGDHDGVPCESIC